MNTVCKSAYLSSVLDPRRLKVVVKLLVKVIKRKVGLDNFDAIAYRGMSGAGVATTLGYLFGKPLLLVRKGNVSCHTSRRTEGAVKAERILVVDDCIATGETLVTMVRDILNGRVVDGDNDELKPLKVVALVMYNDTCSDYYLLTGEETLQESFRGFIASNIRGNADNFKAFEAMKEMKVYNFGLESDGERRGKTVYKVYAGCNLEVDDLK